MSYNCSSKCSFLVVTVLSFSIALSGFFISNTLKKSQSNNATVRGLSERIVEANIASLRIGGHTTSKNSKDIKMLHDKLNDSKDKLIALLHNIGFSDDDMQINAIRFSKTGMRNDVTGSYEYDYSTSFNIVINTDKINLIDQCLEKLSKFYLAEFSERDIEYHNGDCMYKFTKLNDIKTDMLRDATMNAKLAAEEFAKNVGASVGVIKNATQGNFVITDVNQRGYSSDVHDKKKNVRVVSTISFYLK